MDPVKPKHHPRKYSTEGSLQHPDGHKQKLTVFCYACGCGDVRQFKTRAARDKAAQEHSER